MQPEERDVKAVFPDAYAAYLPYAPSLGVTESGWLIRATVWGNRHWPLTSERFETKLQAWAATRRALPFWQQRGAA